MHTNAGRSSGRVTTTGGLIALSVLWFPINLFWTVMLQWMLPHRVQEIVGDQAKGEYLGYIAIVGAIATTVIQLVVAPLSDASGSRWGRRHPFIAWGILLNAFACAGFALAPGFGALMAAFFGIQLFLNVANGPYQALLPDNVPPSRHGMASAFMGAVLLVGQLVGGLMLFLLRKQLGVGGMLAVAVALLVVGAAITLLRVPDAPAPPEDRLPAGKALASLLDLRLGEHPSFVRMLASRFFINLSYSTVTTFLLYYLQDAIGLGKDGAGSLQGQVILIATVAGLLGTLAAGKSLSRFTKKQVVYASGALIGLAALIFAFTASKTMVLVLAFLFGAAWGAFQAVDWALAVNLLPEGGSAKYMAVWHACMTVPQIIAPAFGRVADAINKQYQGGVGWRAAMLSTVIYLAIGLFILRWVTEKPTNDTATDGEVVFSGGVPELAGEAETATLAR
jgi:MFS family permease